MCLNFWDLFGPAGHKQYIVFNVYIFIFSFSIKKVNGEKIMVPKQSG